MATVEIEEDVLEQLKMAHNLQKRLYEGKGKSAYEKALKDEFGDKYATLEEKAAPVLDPLRQELKELREWKKSMQEDKQDKELHKTFARLKKEQGYTDEGIEQIQKIMVERNVADPEAAAAYWEKKNPPQKAIESNGYGESGYHFADGIDDKDSVAQQWFNDPNRMLDKIAHEEITKARK